jgi:hypothetical protein
VEWGGKRTRGKRRRGGGDEEEETRRGRGRRE